jgi:mycofactocin precursor
MTVTTEDSPIPSTSTGQAQGSADRVPDTPTDRPLGALSEDLVEEDLLVEDVSIDGMCGVY